jgi:hypothetical protein
MIDVKNKGRVVVYLGVLSNGTVELEGFIKTWHFYKKELVLNIDFQTRASQRESKCLRLTR